MGVLLTEADYRCAPDLRVESRFKNAVLYRVMVTEFPVRDFVRSTSIATGVCMHNLYSLLALKVSPYRVAYPEGTGRKKKGVRYPLDTTQPTENAKKLAAYFGLSHAELFPPSLYALRLPAVVVREMYSPEVLSLQQAGMLTIAAPQEQAVFKRERGEILDRALRGLPPRAEKVVRLRFGIGREREHTYEEIGEEMGISKSRIQQIENRAMRLLRSPTTTNELPAAVDFVTTGSRRTKPRFKGSF